MASGKNVQGQEWVETWEDADGGKWELSWWEDHEGTKAQLGCHGRPIQNGLPIGNGKILDLLCSDHVPIFASGSGAEENYGFIAGVEVQSDYRGIGIGSMLIRRGIEWMRARGCNGCVGRLQNDGDNDARERFWKRLEFEILFNASGRPTWVRRSF